MAVCVELPCARTPEEVGVSSTKMLEMFKLMEKTDYHGFMVIRHGKIAAQWFRKPYTSTAPHAMYSVSKSISAIAIGFAVSEGLISLDDKVVDFFPEYVPSKCDSDLKKVAIKHLITLSAGRDISPLKSKVKNDWIEIFMKSKSAYTPGENFSYINECFHIALAMLRKVTGVSTVEYLTPRLFEPLEIPVPFWESDHNGVEAGGWGLFLSATDLAKVAICFMNNGVYNGKQVIPQEWIAQALVNRKGPKAKIQNNHNFGYGYGLWIKPGEEPPVRFDGRFGQVAEIYKKYDAVAVIIGGDIHAANRDIIFNYFPESFIDEQPNAEPNEELAQAISKAEYKVLFSEYRSPIENIINDKCITFSKKRVLNMLDFQVSVIPTAATYMSKYRAGNITDVRFNFKSDSVNFSWCEGDETNSIDCGLDGKWRSTKMLLTGVPYTSYAAAAWKNNNTLMLNIRPQESFCARNLKFIFSGNKVKMKPSSDPPIDAILDGVRGTIKSFLKSEKLTDKLLTWGKNYIEPVHSGRFRK
ncbi:MAG TPA: serine hydrolase [Clostridia bacterium]|nr:serine hydrolase [Clostridia bacterium]